MKAVLPLAALCLSAQIASAGCASDPAPCSLPSGTYHVTLPEGAGPHRAVVLLHGYGGNGEGMANGSGTAKSLLDRGYAVIAPDGQLRPEGEGRSWDFHPDREATRDEGAFIIAVADAAAARFDLDRDHMLLAGFSIGGSMTSYLACATPTAFSAYAPVAGSFWRPHPTGCKGPVRLLHTHGWADMTVPLEGREIFPGFVQGDVFAALEIWRETGGCSRLRPDDLVTKGIYSIRSWTSCQPGARLDFALHDGGHSIPKGWATLALDWFEALP
jgi:polyhydroxybutyrate depolymerase